jgi:hypothetical protein
MKFPILGITLLLWVALLIGVKSLAASTGTVTATVTVSQLSVAVYDGSVTYGTLSSSATNSTGALSDTQRCTNDGNITEVFNIRGTTSSPSLWTLAASVGDEQYRHSFSTTSGTWTALTTSYLNLYSAVAVAATRPLNLEVQVPSSTVATASNNVNVTVQASQ